MKSSLSEQGREKLAQVFAQNFRERGEIGASVSVWQGEEEIVSLAGGHMDRERSREWTGETLVPVWSATKGPATVACLLALDEAGLTIHDRVCDVWPCFATAGKERITFAQVLSHTAGLCALDKQVSILDFDAVVGALEEQEPNFPPGTCQAYHARTFGFIIDKIIRQLTDNQTLGIY
ncbi:MAG: serine hydrolase domain-containing protein, partial [Verrucomicrobiaceae bacterium]